MIQFASESIRSELRSMWKTVFDDKDEYIDLIFSEKYKDENTLVYLEGEKVVAALQMFPYTIRFYRQPVTFYYLAGLCTLPEFRNRGYMGKLILESFRVMQSRSISLSILVPAEKWLFGYYEKYGYTETFEKGQSIIDLDLIIDSYNTERTFDKFDEEYQSEDFTVLKTKEDLDIIIQDYNLDGCPLKYNLSAMSRIIDALPLLQLYAKSNQSKQFVIKVKDELLGNDKLYKINTGEVKKIEKEIPDLEVDIQLLTRLLFGYKIEELDAKYLNFFDEHHPIINLMLE